MHIRVTALADVHATQASYLIPHTSLPLYLPNFHNPLQHLPSPASPSSETSRLATGLFGTFEHPPFCGIEELFYRKEDFMRDF